LADGKTAEQAKAALLEETALASRTSDSSQEVFVEDGWTKNTEKTQLEALALEFDTIQEATSALRKKNEKTESKLAVLTGGLAKRAQGVNGELLQMYGDLRNAIIEEAVYADLKDQEQRGGVGRIDRLRGDIAKLQQDEAELQGIYQELVAKGQPSEAIAQD
jgi:hypothetical protein